MINVDCNVWFMKEWKNKKVTWFGIKVCYEKDFFDFCDYLHVFCFFWIIRLKLN